MRYRDPHKAAGWGTEPYVGQQGGVQSLMLGSRVGYRDPHKAAGWGTEPYVGLQGGVQRPT